MIATDEATTQIERILLSDTLRSSEGLRRLLRFLADKAISGDAGQLKEYSIGIDAFGKPASYDPRQDSTVRIQAGRLRQKLAEYYLTEGIHDPILIELPKGHYKLNWGLRTKPVSRLDLDFPPAIFPNTAPAFNWRHAFVAVAAILLAVTAWAVYATVRLSGEHQSAALFRSQWPPELATIWGPFVDTSRPLLISISAPLFVNLPGYGFFRSELVNHPEEIAKSPSIATIVKALHLPAPEPFYYYGTLGGANASFILGKVLSPRKANISLVNGNELSWGQVSENNVIFIGSPRFFNQQIASMPVEPDLYLEPGVGIRNLHPRGAEPAMYIDDHTNEKGFAWTLVSRIPGPQGNTDVMSFGGRNGVAMAGAVAWFTEPATARELVKKLRKPSGEIPRYYQVLLKVRFQDGVALETSYVLHRELRATAGR